jgi:hypothetical protein
MAEEPKDLPSLANTPWWELRIALEENKILKSDREYRRIPGPSVRGAHGLCLPTQRGGQSSCRSPGRLAQWSFELWQFDMQLEIATSRLLAYESVRISEHGFGRD